MQMTRRSFVRSAAAVGIAPFAASWFTGCGGDAARNELVVAAASTPPSLDWELVIGKEVYDHVFNLNDRLTRWKRIPAPDEEGGFDLAWQAANFEEITEPRMAESWEVADGGRTYTFSLRRGWPSHAGNELTAADVKWTFDRSFAVDGITSFFNQLARIRRPSDVKVLDRYTIRIELAEPGPSLLLTMSEFWRAIVDSQLARSGATSADPWAKEFMRTHDVGFGPYALAELEPDRHVIWTAHKEHPYPASIDQITFEKVADSASRRARLERGDADVAQYLLPSDMQRVRAGRDLRLWSFQGYGIHSCLLNPRHPPLDDVRVRQALSFATPYQRIVDTVYGGLAGPAFGPLSDHAAGFDPAVSPFTHDPARARELLREAGHAGGFATTLAYGAADPLGAPVSRALQRAFAAVGVRVALEELSPESYARAIFDGSRPMLFTGIGADSPDPAYALGVFYASDSSNNWSDYRSDRADACLADAGRPSMSWGDRVRAHRRCARLIARDAPWIWIAQPGFQVSARRDLTGINWYAGEAVDWSLVRYAES